VPWSFGRLIRVMDAGRPTSGDVVLVQAEGRHHAGQLVRLILQAFNRGGRLLHQRGILLRHLVKLRHGLAHLPNADVRHALHAVCRRGLRPPKAFTGAFSEDARVGAVIGW